MTWPSAKLDTKLGESDTATVSAYIRKKAAGFFYVPCFMKTMFVSVASTGIRVPKPRGFSNVAEEINFVMGFESKHPLFHDDAK